MLSINAVNCLGICVRYFQNPSSLVAAESIPRYQVEDFEPLNVGNGLLGVPELLDGREWGLGKVTNLQGDLMRHYNMVDLKF